MRCQYADLCRSIGVGHANLPGIGSTAIDRYCEALPCRDFIFRDHAYIVADKKFSRLRDSQAANKSVLMDRSRFMRLGVQQAGFKAHLAKPIDPNKLLKTILEVGWRVIQSN